MVSTADHVGHLYPNVSVDSYATVHLGDIHHHEPSHDRNKTKDEIPAFGLCLGKAPQIEPEAFKGLTNELQQLRNCVLPLDHSPRRRIVSIVGMGGMGKTQFDLAHARECAHEYSSAFWVNAKDETSLRRGLAIPSSIIFPDSAGVLRYKT